MQQQVRQAEAQGPLSRAVIEEDSRPQIEIGPAAGHGKPQLRLGSLVLRHQDSQVPAPFERLRQAGGMRVPVGTRERCDPHPAQ
jgi:hypothetical protein